MQRPRLRHVREVLSPAHERLRIGQGVDSSGAEIQKAQAVVDERTAQGQLWGTGDNASRRGLVSLLLLVHLWRLVASTR